MAEMCYRYRHCTVYEGVGELAFSCNARTSTMKNMGARTDDEFCSLTGEPYFCDGSKYKSRLKSGEYCSYLMGDQQRFGFCIEMKHCEYVWDSNGSSCKKRTDSISEPPAMPAGLLALDPPPNVAAELAAIPKTRKLPSLRVHSPTSSGFSSGCYMSSLLNVVHSATMKGFGCLGGGPYGAYYNYKYYNDQGLIDNISNLQDKRVIIQHGTQDEYTAYEQAVTNRDWWKNEIGIPENQINDDYLGIDAYHNVPSAFYGPTGPGTGCLSFENEYSVVNCASKYPDYDSSVASICWLYPDLNCFNSGVPSSGGKASNVVSKGNYNGWLTEFSQEEFCLTYTGNTCEKIYMSKTGHIYIPNQCIASNGNCKLHLVLHGCGLTAMNYGTEYMKRLTMFELADKFGIVLLIPSANNFENGESLTGCWNPNGYLGTGTIFMTGENPQLKVFKGMIDRLMGEWDANGFLN